VNNSRSLARGLALLTADAALRRELVRCQIAYALALRCHLLKRAPWDDIGPYVPDETLERLRGVANVPAGIQDAMAGALRRGGMGSIGLSALDATLSALANAQGGLERIKNTPLARQYMQFPLVFSRVYCLLLPLGLLSDLGVLTPIGSTVIGFMFLALDRIGQDLEDPFEGRVHDIPMGAITRTIEIDLLQSIGAAEVPAPVAVTDGVVW
jgi:putative membrane protein